MQEYHFNAALAQRYGVDGAVFLHAMAFWVAKNKANGRHFHEGRYWTYNTRKALAELFPFWTQRQLERIVNNLRDAGAVLVGNFSEDKADRTLWYALSNDVLEAYGESADPISPNGEMHFTDPCDPFHQTGKCNKETVTNQLYIPPISPKGGQGGKKKRSPKSVPQWKPERFEKFWAYYPRHEDRVSAVREWDRLRPNDELIDAIARALLWQTKAEDWPAPYACRYLRNQRWLDEPPKPKGQAPRAPAQGLSGWHYEEIDGEKVLVVDEPGD
ncbi:hypothetical protein WMO64_14055 [Pseudoflavonifractor sp. CLA-AP-H29]|uniref:Replication protein n=1 Tax=Pseudoflavonifractor intestinihominis TaxID=3133171 RepID=A0ABV1EBB7_9FIRM